MESEQYELVGICEKDSEKLGGAKAEFQVDHVILFDDVDTMLETARPDVFTFVTDPTIRLPLVKKAAEHGLAQDGAARLSAPPWRRTRSAASVYAPVCS